MSEGNMYNWVTKTWNPVGGTCLLAWKVEKLIKELEEFTEVKIKKNLSRILKEGIKNERAVYEG